MGFFMLLYWIPELLIPPTFDPCTFVYILKTAEEISDIAGM
jgi:hypothetical protein